MVWLAYIGGDALAVYALATLFNCEKQRQTMTGGGGDNNAALEVVWAPVLLIHLGGQHISAYSLEDNELWRRHAITLVSQVTVALYVFCKWWSGEKRLLQAAVLLFVVGILRFSEKPWALRRAFRTLASNPSPPREENCSSLWSGLFFICTRSTWDIEEQLMWMVEEGRDQDMDHVSSLQEYVRRAQEKVQVAKIGDRDDQEEEFDKNKTFAMKYIIKLFVDLSAPYYIRLRYWQSFLKFDDKYQHKILRQWIKIQFTIMHSKSQSSGDTCLTFCLLHVLLLGLALASVVLFAVSAKDGYSKSDIMVTYILLAGTAIVEYAVLLELLCQILYDFFVWLREQLRDRRDLPPDGAKKPFWYSSQDMVSQHNIMLFSARKKKPTTLMKLAVVEHLRDYINKHWYIWHEPAAEQISILVRRHAEYGWKEYIHDPAMYRRFNNFRGDHTLRTHQLLGEEQLGWSINLPFDECVLLWHIATDLCLHHSNYGSSSNSSSSCGSNTTRASSSQSHQSQEGGIESRRSSSEIISNYMVYLLFIWPDMLMLGTRQDLFMHTCGEIERMIQDLPSSLSLSHDKRSIAQRILMGSATGAAPNVSVEQGGGGELTRGVVSSARALAQRLIHGLDEEERWVVMQGVWVELLCYSAGRCRGFEHAKSLARGGEYLTNVWLLWSVMVMETLPDKMHNLGPPEPDPAAS